MLRDGEAFYRGLEIMRDLTGATEVTVAVKRKNADVLDEHQGHIDSRGFLSFIYEDVYPAGDEYCLVYEITGRQIPPGGIPVQVGCVVDNVETIINVAKAADGIPVTEKYLTMTGAVAKPFTTRLPIGTSFE